MGCTQEFGPTEETIEALIEYLVSPLLPLKHSDIVKEALSESQRKAVAKQIHAAVVLYNYYHLKRNRESEFMNFDQFCNLAIMFKPSILHHMKYMCQNNRPTITDSKNQLSATEKAIMDACTISKTLLNDSANVSSLMKEWPITKVAVFLIDSKKENCFLQFNDGVWSVIEKEICSEESGIGSESKIGKKRMRKDDEEGESGYQKLAFSAIKKVTGIESVKLKVLESHVVYSLSQANTATRFYIVQSTKSISEDNLVPIEDVISSLQGPVVNKCSGSWAITPVVEYYYLLPYAEIISHSFSRSSDNLQIKSTLESGSVKCSNSSKDEPRDSKVAKNTHESDKCGTALEPVIKGANVITSPLKVSTFDQKVKETESSTGNGITEVRVNIINSTKEEPRDSKVAENNLEFNKFVTTLEPVSKVPDNVIMSQMIEEPVEQKVKETENSIGNRISKGRVHTSNTTKEETQDIKGAENSFKSNKSGTSLKPVSKVADDDITSPMIECHVDQKVKETEISIGYGISEGRVHDTNVSKEERRDSKVTESNSKSNKCGTIFKPVSKVADDDITSPMIECHADQKVKETENFIGDRITGTNVIYKVSDNVQIKSKSESEKVRISNLIIEESRDSKVAEKNSKSNKCGMNLEVVNKMEDDDITSPMIVSPIHQKVKEAENSVGNKITGANSDGKKPQDMNGSCRAESMNSSSGASNKSIDKPLVCLQKVNQNTKPQTLLKVYRHAKRTTSTNSKSNKGDLKGLKTISMISERKDENMVAGEKKSCMFSFHENRTSTVNHALEDFNFTVDARKAELSQAALRALLNKRQKLSNQQHIIEAELALCDKKIQAIMQGGVGDCLEIKLEAIIDCCNEICQQEDVPAQQHLNLFVGSSLPKNLSEAQLSLRKACQELDDICLFNNWMLPTYHTSNLNGGFVANVTVKGTNFECSGVSGIQPSIHGARNSAATHVITKLQQMAGEPSTAVLV